MCGIRHSNNSNTSNSSSKGAGVGAGEFHERVVVWMGWAVAAAMAVEFAATMRMVAGTWRILTW